MRIHDPATGKTCFQKRRRRFDVIGTARQFTFCCYRRYAFLSRERTCRWFIDALASARARYPFDLWAYVLMPEHAHLLLYPREPEMKMGAIVGQVKGQVARHAIQFLQENAPHWLARISLREGKRTRRRFWQPGGGLDRVEVI